MNNWEILGLKLGATKEEVKRAYRTLAHKHHPDKGGNAEQFKKVSSAYQDLIKIAPDKPGVYQNPNPNRAHDFWTSPMDMNVADDVDIASFVSRVRRTYSAASVHEILMQFYMDEFLRASADTLNRMKEDLEKKKRQQPNQSSGDPFRGFYGY